MGLYTIGIAALFLAGFFLLVFFGAQMYRNTVGQQTANNETRSLQSYLTNSISAGDASGAVRVQQDADVGTVLVIADKGSSYALRIYCRDGKILEDYAKETSPLRPERANEISSGSVLEAEEVRAGTLKITTDGGSFLVSTRSADAVATEGAAR